MKEIKKVYLKKGHVGYEFCRGHYYYNTAADGKKVVVGNTYTITKVVLHGFTCTKEIDSYDTAEEGNAVFTELIEQGFKLCTNEEYDALKSWD